MNNNSICNLCLQGAFILLIYSCGSKPKPTPQPTPQPQPVVVEQFVVNVPGENLTALSKITDSEYKCSTPYGGDNNRNLFFSVRTNGTLSYSNIFKKENTLGAGMSQKTSGNNNNTTPTYCAATNMMAFAGEFEGSKHRDIYMLNASQGNALIQVTSTPDAEECYPDFSQDGRKIVYQKYTNILKLEYSEIWIKDLKTNENIMLGLGRMPSFSPDGRMIVYTKNQTENSPTTLWIMNVDGSNPMQLTNSSQGDVYRPRFSPDGEKIVFQCYKKDKGDSDLFVIDKDGNNVSQLTINKSFDGEPYWAKDWNIYFTSDRGGRAGHRQIWRFRYGNVIPIIPQDKNDTEIIKKTNGNGDYHTVLDGETITDIARRYGVTVKDIVKWNNLMTMTITPGMRLKVSPQ